MTLYAIRSLDTVSLVEEGAEVVSQCARAPMLLP